MAEELKKTGLMDGMGEGDDDDFNKRHKNKDKIVRWITVNGQHVPILEDQTTEEAIEQAFEKKDEKTDKNESVSATNSAIKNNNSAHKANNKLSSRDNVKNMGIIQLKKLFAV